MDVIALENAARKIRFVGVPAFELFERGLFVPERFEEGEREVRRVERLFRELGNGFFDFDGVHRIAGTIAAELSSVMTEPRRRGVR